MWAVEFTGPASDASGTCVTAINRPRPGPGQVSLDVSHAGINFKDVMARRGDQGYVDRWPFVPGLDAAGTVREVGPGVTSLAPGTRVAAYLGQGGLAEVAVADARLTVAVPPGLDLAVAAAAPGALVSAELLVTEIGRVRPGESVLVHGAAGGVGQAVAQFARRRGAGLLVGTVGSPARVEAARQAGYDRVIARTTNMGELIRSAAGGAGVDVVLDPQGTALLEMDLAALAPGGRIIVFGNAGGGAVSQLPDLGRLFAGNASVGGFSLAALAASSPDVVAAAVKRVLADLTEGNVHLDVTVHDGLGRAAQVQQWLADGSAAGKQVIRIER